MSVLTHWCSDLYIISSYFPILTAILYTLIQTMTSSSSSSSSPGPMGNARVKIAFFKTDNFRFEDDLQDVSLSAWAGNHRHDEYLFMQTNMHETRNERIMYLLQTKLVLRTRRHSIARNRIYSTYYIISIFIAQHSRVLNSEGVD